MNEQKSIYYKIIQKWVNQPLLSQKLNEYFDQFLRQIKKKTKLNIVFDRECAATIIELISQNLLNINNGQSQNQNKQRLKIIAQVLYLNRFISKKDYINIQNKKIEKENHKIQTKSSRILQKIFQKKLLKKGSNSFNRVMRQIDQVINKIKTNIDIDQIQFYGSLQSGFALTNCSDADINIKLKNHQNMINSQSQKKLLYKIRNTILSESQQNKQSQYRAFVLCSSEKKKVKVQVLTLYYQPKLQTNYVKKIDIVINNEHGVNNSKLLKKYFQSSQHIQMLGILAKLWATKYHIIQKTKLSSYGVLLMVLYFLMETKQIPFLPEYQNLSENHKIILNPTEFPQISDNFIDFLNFYSQNSSFYRQKQCVRITKSAIRHYDQKLLINMVDPLDYTNPGRMKVTNQNLFFKCIKQTILTLKKQDQKQIEQLFIIK